LSLIQKISGAVNCSFCHRICWIQRAFQPCEDPCIRRSKFDPSRRSDFDPL